MASKRRRRRRTEYSSDFGAIARKRVAHAARFPLPYTPRLGRRRPVCRRDGDMLADKRLFFLGAGSMSEAILKGLSATAVLPPGQIMDCNRQHLPRLEELQEH